MLNLDSKFPTIRADGIRGAGGDLKLLSMELINLLRKSKCFDTFIAKRLEIEVYTKGQLISKADWRAIDSPKKRTDEGD